MLIRNHFPPWLATGCMICAAMLKPAQAAERKTMDAPADAHAEAQMVTLELAKADIADALRMIASQAGINLIIGPDVKGEVSVSLTRVSVVDALRAVALGNGLQVNSDNGIVTVTKPPATAADQAIPTMTTRVFRPRSVSATDLRWALEPALSPFRDKNGKLAARITVLNEDSRPGYGMSLISGDTSSGQQNPPAGNTSTGVQVNPLQAVGGAAAAGLTAAMMADDPTRSVQVSQVLLVTGA